MRRLYTEAEIDKLTEDRVGEIVLYPGDMISPQAADIAKSRGISVVWREAQTSAAEAVPTSLSPELGAPSGPCECGDRCGCTSDGAAAEVDASLREIIEQIRQRHPNADAESLVDLTWRELGVATSPARSSTEQAQPVGGSRLPKQARGGRPQFMPDPGMDALVSIVTSLMSEVWVLYERIDTLEHLLDEKRVLGREQLDGFAPEGEALAEREAAALAFNRRVLRTFRETWEQVEVGDEYDEDYMAVVARAYSQVDRKDMR